MRLGGSLALPFLADLHSSSKVRFFNTPQGQWHTDHVSSCTADLLRLSHNSVHRGRRLRIDAAAVRIGSCVAAICDRGRSSIDTEHPPVATAYAALQLSGPVWRKRRPATRDRNHRLRPRGSRLVGQPLFVRRNVARPRMTCSHSCSIAMGRYPQHGGRHIRRSSEENPCSP